MTDLTSLSTIRELCHEHGFSLSKGYGQNFIVNPGVCPKICDAAQVGAGSQVLEIGPGFGTLTQQLALRAGRVVSVEIDGRLLPVLGQTLAPFDNVRIVHEDFMQCDLPALIRQYFDGAVTVCANLPYYITSPILMKLLESRLPFENITVMVQKEAAQRITAPPGSREAGAISYAVAYYAGAKMDFTVKPGSFYPPPKVTSAVITLTPQRPLALASQPQREARLFRLIRAAFGQRRKTLANAASAGLALPKQQLQDALAQAGISPMARPEQLTLAQYIQLEQCLWP